MIKPFTLGVIGSLISAVSIGVIFVMGFFPVVRYWDMNLYGAYFFYAVFSNFFWLLFGVGMVLASFGYRGLREKYDVLFGNVGFVFGLVASVFAFSAAVAGIIVAYYMILSYPPPLINSILFWVRLFNLIFFGFVHVVWGIAFLTSKRFCKKSKLSLVASGFFVASGLVVLSTFSPRIGLVLSFVSLLFASTVFLTFRSNS